MQNKGVIKLLAVILAVISLYQLSFSFVTRQVEKKAAEYATSAESVKMAETLANGDQNAYDYLLDSIQGARETYYLDSMSTVKVYPVFGQTYRQAKEMEINLGLDLKGGMNVMMEVSVPDIIEVLSGHSTYQHTALSLEVLPLYHLLIQNHLLVKEASWQLLEFLSDVPTSNNTLSFPVLRACLLILYLFCKYLYFQ